VHDIKQQAGISLQQHQSAARNEGEHCAVLHHAISTARTAQHNHEDQDLTDRYQIS
jgi:hypothetical protein